MGNPCPATAVCPTTAAAMRASFTPSRTLPLTSHRSSIQPRRSPLSKGASSRSQTPLVLAKSSVDEQADQNGWINKLTVFLADSPINQGKLWFAKTRAGDYDVEATQAQLQSLINENPVLMFSFTT